MAKQPPEKTPNQIGEEWEQRVAALTGGSRVPGSGNQWHSKLDVTGHSFLWSCKATLANSFRLTKDHVYEAVRAVIGPGGKGGRTIPAIALKIQDEELVVLQFSDFLELLKEDSKVTIPLTKKEKKMKSGLVPLFQRELEEDKQ